jgi:hypothetical protein
MQHLMNHKVAAGLNPNSLKEYTMTYRNTVMAYRNTLRPTGIQRPTGIHYVLQEYDYGLQEYINMAYRNTMSASQPEQTLVQPKQACISMSHR